MTFSCMERTPTQPLISADKGNEFCTRPERKHLLSRLLSLRYGPRSSETMSDVSGERLELELIWRQPTIREGNGAVWKIFNK